MYIVNVIPLLKIPLPNPQILSYFCEEKIKIGGIVKISVRNKKIKAVVVDCKKLEQEKIRLKKFADFQIKPIEKIISKEPVLTNNQLKLLFWMAEYYFSPVGLVARIFLAKKYQIQDTKYQIQNLTLTPQTKSLVFAPFKKLKSITIEDESSPLYRSWGRKPYYNAKDIAIQLAKIFKAKLILKSKLPNIETYYWSKKKKYKLIIQDTKYQILDTKLVDMRTEIKNGNFSIISRKLQEELKKAKKSILYISRRGTATFILCRDCGYVIKCSHCDVPLIYHQNTSYLLCHHCGNKVKPPTLCPNCRGYRIKYFGAGTQRVEIEAKKLFPKAKIFRLDSDVAKTPTQQEKIIKNFNKSRSAILIGAQMLLDKNLKADLAGIVSIETILNLPNYKSSERIFQIVNKLQKMTKKEFLVQTYNPENFVIQVAIKNNFSKLYNEEIRLRKALNYPPFSQIIKLTFEHKDPEKTHNQAKILFQKLQQQIRYKLQATSYKLQLLGPVPAFIPKIKERYRWNIIIKSQFTVGQSWAEKTKLRNKLLMIVPPTWSIEVDPESLL